MEPILTSTLLGLGGKLIEKLFPDPAARARAQLDLARLEQEGELEELKAEVGLLGKQIEVNLADAASGIWWQAGWRPFIGWVCGGALFYNFVLRDMWVWWTSAINPALPQPPPLQLDQLVYVLMSLLGIGAMRSFDKWAKRP